MDSSSPAPPQPPPAARRLLRALARAPGRLVPRKRPGAGRDEKSQAGLASLSAVAYSAGEPASGGAPPADLPPTPLPLPAPSPLDAAAAALDSAIAAITSAMALPWLTGRETPPPPAPGISEADAAWRVGGCFPSRIAPTASTTTTTHPASPPAPAGGTHHLAAVGTRAFSLWGASLRIYDFGVYVSPDAAAASPALGGPAAPDAHAADPIAFSRALRSADDVPKTLLVRTRRALPLPLMKAEYARILTRRIALVGGDPSDTALTELIGLFRSDVLPPSARGPAGMVRAGTVLEFGRAPGGRLTVSLDGVRLADVASPPLAAAVFDIYLGADLPCCPAAQAAAAVRVARWAGGGSGGGGGGTPGRLSGPQWRDTVEEVEASHEPGPLAPELVCGRGGGGGTCAGRRAAKLG